MEENLVLRLVEEYTKRMVKVSMEKPEYAGWLDILANGKKGLITIPSLVLALIPPGKTEPEAEEPIGETDPLGQFALQMVAWGQEDEICQSIAQELVDAGHQELETIPVILVYRGLSPTTANSTVRSFVDTMNKLLTPDTPALG